MKLSNSEVLELMEFLNRCENVKRSQLPDDKIRQLTFTMAVEILYCYNSKIAMKYRRYNTKPHFTVTFKIEEAAAFIAMYLTIGSNNPVVQKIVQEIDPKL